MWQLLHSDEPTQNYHPTLLFPPALKGFSSSISSFSLFQRLTWLLSWFMVLPRTTHQTDTFSNSLVNEAEYFLFVSVGLILLPTSSKKERNTCECLKTFYYTEFVKEKKKKLSKCFDNYCQSIKTLNTQSNAQSSSSDTEPSDEPSDLP